MNTGNLNGQGIAELQNYRFQNLQTAPTTNLGEGRFYFSTADHTLYVYNGTAFVDALSQGVTYSEGSGIDITGTTISVDLATGANAGNVTLTTTNGLAANVAEASTTAKGIIEIATDTEASTGTATDLAVTPKQLATKVTANNAITGATKCKITYDAKGLVTAGADLAASDIPNLSLSKITDVTATATEVNVLDGITASTAELNILDGVTVSASDINSVTSKISLSNLSIASGSTNYLEYDNTNGQFGAKVDTTVTASSTNLVTSGAVEAAIGNALTGALTYQGTWTATNQTDYSSITLPVKKGYMYAVSGTATIGGVEWNSGDYLVINKDVASGGTITSADVEKIDNTEASDIVRLSATQTLKNKTISADNNTISDLTSANLKSGVLKTTIRDVSSASESAIASEKAVASAINGIVKKYSVQNPALTQAGGVCSFPVTHNLNSTDVEASLYEVSTGKKVLYDYSITSANVVTYEILSATNISAGTYKAVIQG